MSIPDLAPWRWVLGAIAALLVGIAKTGVPGFGTVAVPLMVLAVGDAKHSAGWLLPLLCVADLFAVGIYRRHAYARRLITLLPWVLVGMAAGAFALSAPERVLRPVVATIVLVMIGFRWRRLRAEAAARKIKKKAAEIAETELLPLEAPPSVAAALSSKQPSSASGESWPQSAAYGGAAGFATTIANAAGPIMSLYLLARRLPKDEFLGTGAWFFLIVNLCKLPVYVGHGLIGARSLSFDVALLPALVAGAGLGRVLIGRVSQETFERLVFALTVLATVLLFIPK